jgi:hypothetical protein
MSGGRRLTLPASVASGQTWMMEDIGQRDVRSSRPGSHAQDRQSKRHGGIDEKGQIAERPCVLHYRTVRHQRGRER